MPKAPAFALQDISNVRFNFKGNVPDNKWLLLYFFDIQSKACREGLISLSSLRKKYNDQLLIYTVTTNSPDEVRSFVDRTSVAIPVLLDRTERVSEQYDALTIFPKTVLINSRGRIVQSDTGDAGTVSSLLAALSDKFILNRQTDYASKLLDSPEIKKMAVSESARDRLLTAQGYAAVGSGDYRRAESTFSKVNDETLRLEGLSAAAYRKGDERKAKNYTNQLLAKDPDNTYGHTIQAKMLFKKGDAEAALREYERAVTGRASLPWQQAEAANDLGRAYAKLDRKDEALTHYDKSISIYPDYIIPLSNKGVELNRQGKYEKASRVLKKAVSINPDDRISQVILKKNEDDMVFSRDYEKQAWVRKLVKDLIHQYRIQKRKKGKKKADWTSPPLTVALLPMDQADNDPERDGVAEMLYLEISRGISKVKRFKSLDRRVMDKILEELQIGSTELASEKTRLEIGRIMAARTLAASDIIPVRGGAYYIGLRVIQTETSEIVMNETRKVRELSNPAGLSDWTADVMLRVAESRYPFRAKVVRKEGDSVIINLGSSAGMTPGVRMEIFTEGKPVVFEGEVLGRPRKRLAVIEVSQVMDKMSFARIVSVSGGGIRKGMKVQELSSMDGV
jgi:tetratricopeptide (TPR) repeat protein